MIKPWCISTVVLGAVLVPLLASATPIVIYDNTGSGFTGAVSTTQLEIGDEVHAAGIAREVTLLEIGVNDQSLPFTAELEARLYANDGADGQPGTLLWEGSEQAALSTGNNLVPFAVPGVLVPDTFTWTLQYGNLPIVLPSFGPATIGSSPEIAWFGGPGIWTTFGGSSLGRIDLESRVTAEEVAEPSAMSLLALGLACLLGAFSRRRRRLRVDSHIALVRVPAALSRA
jgi:hypothetical protein